MKYVFYILIMVSLAGCRAKRPIVNTVSTLDSVHVDHQVKLRDTLIKIPAYSVGVSSPAGELGEKPVTGKNGNAGVQLYQRNDTIFANAFCDSLELQLQLKDSIINTYRLKQRETTTTLPPVEIKYVPGFVKFLAWTGGIGWLLGLVWIGYKIFKPKFI